MILPFKWNITSFATAWNKELFYAKYPANSEYKWCDTDLPESAIFQDDSITYKFNEYGFRSESFSNRSEYNILVSGCSLTVGIGVPFGAVWFNKLKDKIQQTGKTVTVWNLAQSGTSPDYAVRSVYKTKDILKPDAVVILWPADSRFEFPENVYSDKLQDFMLPDPDLSDQLDYPRQLMNEYYFAHELRKNIIFMEMLCAQHSIPFIHGGAPNTPVNVEPREGARDRWHPDTIWHEQWGNAVFDYWSRLQT